MGAISRALGRALVYGMPGFLTFLSAAGTAAMIWVGGGIIVHGLEAYGPPSIGHAIHAAAEAAAHALPAVGGLLEWIVEAAISGRDRTGGRRGVNPGHRICRCARVEAVEAASAGLTARASDLAGRKLISLDRLLRWGLAATAGPPPSRLERLRVRPVSILT